MIYDPTKVKISEALHIYSYIYIWLVILGVIYGKGNILYLFIYWFIQESKNQQSEINKDIVYIIIIRDDKILFF